MKFRWHSSLVLRVLVWLICLTGFLYQTSGIVDMYLSYPFTVTIVEQVRTNILFPGITVCLESWMNITRLCELYPDKCSANSQKISPGVYHIQFDSKMRNESAYSVRDVFRCTMRSTVTTCFSFNCLEIMRLSYYRPPVSMCYTVDAIQYSDDDHRFKKCNMPWTWELSLRAAWRPEKSLRLQSTGKLPLIIHRSETVPPDRLSSITIKPGMSYTVSVSQQTIRRLPNPFASRCTDYIARGIKPQFMGYLTQDLCLQECLLLFEQKYCQCIRFSHEFGMNFPYKTCSVEETTECDKILPNETATVCQDRCGPACVETIYDVRLTSLGDDKKEKDRDSFSVAVKFSSDSQKIFEYQPKLTLIEAFGYMGGYVGMWLGLSLFSLIVSFEKWLRRIFLRRLQARLQALQRNDSSSTGYDTHNKTRLQEMMLNPPGTGNVPKGYPQIIHRRF